MDLQILMTIHTTPPLVIYIKNHINQAQKTLKLSLVDQENISMKVTEYSRLSSKAKIHFILFTKSDENENNTELLWVHQEL